MKIKCKQQIVCLLIPLAVGGLAGLITMGSMADYQALNRPPLSPPGWLFPVIWTILYLLMGYASYLVVTSDAPRKSIVTALTVYGVQLAVNFVWPILFFNLGLYLFSFIWLVLLLILIYATIFLFGQISKPAAVLLIPYLLWVTFAGHNFAWASWQTAAYLGSSLVLLALATVVELRHPEPLVPLRVLRNRTAVLVIVASVSVGTAMFGGSVFLTQYLQIARGYSPTEAGLLTMPVMLGSFVAATVAGQIITRTGRWKVFLVIGGVLLTSGLAGLGTIDHATPIWRASVFMGLMGLGMGALMQNLMLAVQNTVDVSQIGATSATVAFFRTLGGAVGVSVLGAVLANRVKDGIAEGLLAMGVKTSGSSAGASLDLGALPAPIAHLVRTTYADATGHIFVIAAVVSLVALAAILLIKEVPLRTSVHLPEAQESAVAASAGVPDLGEPAEVELFRATERNEPART
jgi:tryptophan-rich sensory protein